MKAFASKGVIGILSLLLFYWLFINIFTKNIVSGKGKEQKTVALCGLMFVLQFILCGMTEAPLLGNAISTFFIFSVSLFLAILASNGVCPILNTAKRLD